MLQNGSVRKQFSGLLQFVTVCLDNLVHLAILLKFVRVYLDKIYKFGTDHTDAKESEPRDVRTISPFHSTSFSTHSIKFTIKN